MGSATAWQAEVGIVTAGALPLSTPNERSQHRSKATRNMAIAGLTVALFVVLVGAVVTVVTAPPTVIVTQTVFAAGLVDDPGGCNRTPLADRNSAEACDLIQRRTSALPAAAHVFRLYDERGPFPLTVQTDASQPFVGTHGIVLGLSDGKEASGDLLDFELASAPIVSSAQGEGLLRASSYALSERKQEIAAAGLALNGGVLAVRMEQRFEFDFGHDSRASIDRASVVVVDDEWAEQRQAQFRLFRIPYDEWTSSYAVKEMPPARGLSLRVIWLGVIAAVAILMTILSVVYWLMRLVALSAERSEAAALELAAEADAQRDRSLRVLAATHHDLNREICLVGFAVDDLAEEIPGAPLEELHQSLLRLEASRNIVAALARLATTAETNVAQTVRARELVPIDAPVPIDVVGNDALHGVDRALLGLLVLTLARVCRYQQMPMTLATDASVLEITAERRTHSEDGQDPFVEETLDAWERSSNHEEAGLVAEFAVVRRVARAHGASVELSEDGAGVWTLRLTFPESTPEPWPRRDQRNDHRHLAPSSVPN